MKARASNQSLFCLNLNINVSGDRVNTVVNPTQTKPNTINKNNKTARKITKLTKFSTILKEFSDGNYF